MFVLNCVLEHHVFIQYMLLIKCVLIQCMLLKMVPQRRL